MIHYIKGLLTVKTPTYVVLETGGIGYHVSISLHTYARIEKLEHVKLLMHHHVREDAEALYGFESEEERELFRLLISVSGVGTNSAMVMLSAMSPEELRAAIIGEQYLVLKKVKGIGDKTAKRIVLDLKDKVSKVQGDSPLALLPNENPVREEALQALVTLGFNKVQTQKVLNKILKEDPALASVEVVIKRALSMLS